jgi:Flp pilus assembly protein TadD
MNLCPPVAILHRQKSTYTPVRKSATTSDRPRRTDFYLLKGYAGSGKSTVLKRVAYETAATFSKPTLFLRPDARLSLEPFEELCRCLGERLFVFLDGVSRRPGEIEAFIRTARKRLLPLTIIVAERSSEWNSECQALSALIDDEHQLRALSIKEIDSVIEKLEQQNALGVLTRKTPDERRHAFLEYADRQLLVALYEVTSGRSFMDIVFDEYRNILSDRARRIYLVICSLNRLGVPVRAGVVHRVCGVSFRDFKDQFFAPLESIVLTEEYKPALDMAYRSRHPWIAQVVFERALPVEADRFDLYIAVLKSLDVGYTADRAAFREMVRARNLLELFPTPRLVLELFDVASVGNENDAYLLQQRAIYEMRRANGNLRRAYELLTSAHELIPHDKSILHSMSELEIARSRAATNPLEQRVHRDQAAQFARSLTGPAADSGHGYATLAKIALDKFKDALEGGTANDEEIAAEAKAVEIVLNDGLQRFRTDEYLLAAEADFYRLVNNDARALRALKTAFETNPASAFIARSLSRAYEDAGDFASARATLAKALNLLPADKSLNASLGRLLDLRFPDDADESEQSWRRSFTSGDTNYWSQFNYARRLYLNGRRDEASRIFEELKAARIPRDVRTRITGWVMEHGTVKVHTGEVYRKLDDYAWVTPLGHSRSIYLPRTEVDPPVWGSLRAGSRIEFSVGFNYLGPAASLNRPRG